MCQIKYSNTIPDDVISKVTDVKFIDCNRTAESMKLSGCDYFMVPNDTNKLFGTYTVCAVKEASNE